MTPFQGYKGNPRCKQTGNSFRLNGAGTGNAVLSNSIHSNGTTAQTLGIDLGADGVTANDAGDGDTGPNNLQNFPVLSSAMKSGATTTVAGTLDSNANSTFRVEFFSNASCDTAGNGEGRTFLGFQNVTTDGTGHATINATLAATTSVGESVTATATDVTLFDHDNNAGTPDIPRNDTSEFSACRVILAPTASATPNPATTNEDTPVTITLTGTDANDNNLTFAITAQPTNGTLGTISAPNCTAVNTCTATVTYTPNANFNGADSFKFKVNDGTVDSAEATVNIMVNPVADLSVGDVIQAEGNTGTTTFTFTVSLDSPAPTGGVTFNASTANGTTNPANAGSDYVALVNQPGSITQGNTSTTVSVTVNGDTTQEADETFTVSVSNVTNAAVSDGQGTGTILNDDGAPAAGQIVISEFRLRGPDPDGAGAETGALDEFIELYNPTAADIIVVDSAPLPALATRGWAIVSSDDMTTAKYTIPVGTRIPARGHFLVTNGLGYSLSAYAAADITPQGSAASYNADIPDNAGLALFRTGNPASFTPDQRLDAVGFTGATLVEGTGLTPAGGITTALQHSFGRRLTSGLPQDTGNNENDFFFVEVNGAASNGRTAILGAPGPENTLSPLQRNTTIKAALIDPTQPSSAPPNRVRDTTSGGAGTATAFGTLDIRRKFTNNTGAPVTALRFRVVDVTTLNSPNPGGPQADLRLLTAIDTTANGGTITIKGTTLAAPSDATLGGGLNASVVVALPGSTLGNGASLNIRFLLGVAASGQFRFLINVEGLNTGTLSGSKNAAPKRAGTF